MKSSDIYVDAENTQQIIQAIQSIICKDPDLSGNNLHEKSGTELNTILKGLKGTGVTHVDLS